MFFFIFHSSSLSLSLTLSFVYGILCCVFFSSVHIYQQVFVIDQIEAKTFSMHFFLVRHKCCIQWKSVRFIHAMQSAGFTELQHIYKLWNVDIMLSILTSTLNRFLCSHTQTTHFPESSQFSVWMGLLSFNITAWKFIAFVSFHLFRQMSISHCHKVKPFVYISLYFFFALNWYIGLFPICVPEKLQYEEIRMREKYATNELSRYQNVHIFRQVVVSSNLFLLFK